MPRAKDSPLQGELEEKAKLQTYLLFTMLCEIGRQFITQNLTETHCKKEVAFELNKTRYPICSFKECLWLVIMNVLHSFFH